MTFKSVWLPTVVDQLLVFTALVVMRLSVVKAITEMENGE